MNWMVTWQVFTRCIPCITCIYFMFIVYATLMVLFYRISGSASCHTRLEPSGLGQPLPEPHRRCRHGLGYPLSTVFELLWNETVQTCHHIQVDSGWIDIHNQVDQVDRFPCGGCQHWFAQACCSCNTCHSSLKFLSY